MSGPVNPHPADVIARATREAKALLQRCLDDPDVSLTKALRRDIQRFLHPEVVAGIVLPASDAGPFGIARRSDT